MTQVLRETPVKEPLLVESMKDGRFDVLTVLEKIFIKSKFELLIG